MTPQLSSAYPGLRVVEIEIHGLSITHSNDDLSKFKKAKQEEIRRSIRSLDDVKNLPILRAYRDFYWSVGIDPTKTRPAGEALIRRILSGRDLPMINTLVDSYNLASAETCVAIAAFDLAVVNRNSLLMRRVREGESFLGIGMQSEAKLTGSEIVIEDISSNELVAVYPYRDSEESKVTEKSRDVLLMTCGIPGISDSDLVSAGALAKEHVERFCEFNERSESPNLVGSEASQRSR